jgi:DNA modification methylase
MVTEETSETIELPKPAFSRDGVTIHLGDCREILRGLPANSVHCCVTSPPYFGLRDYGCEGQIGLESTPAEFVAQMVAVFREVRRVLRDDGVLWLNLGDSYCGYKGDKYGQAKGNLTAHTPVAMAGRFETGTPQTAGVKNKDLIGIPWMVAFALRSDGWYLRQEIIWHKPNPMPESVTDRCTKSHEQMFLLTKSDRYFFDSIAIQEEAVRGYGGSEFHTGKTGEHLQGRASTKPRGGSGNKGRKDGSERGCPEGTGSNVCSHVPWEGETRNKRSVWTVSTKPYGGAHFAVFPPDLIEPCILAGTSEHGCCPDCGTPWRRVIEKDRKATRPGNDTKIGRASDDPDSPYERNSGTIVGNRDPQRHCTVTKTVGWEAGCECQVGTQVPCVVLDPFTGSGTTAEVARKNGCHFVGCELNPEYLKLAADRFKQRLLALQ